MAVFDLSEDVHALEDGIWIRRLVGRNLWVAGRHVYGGIEVFSIGRFEIRQWGYFE